MEGEESLSSILSGADPVRESAEAPAEVKTETQATEKTAVRDESGKFAKAGEAPAQVEAKPAEPQKAEPAKVRPDVAAIIDERRKRQALEAELQQLRQQVQQPTAKPSVFEDEDAAISARVQEHLAPLREGLFYQSMRSAKLTHGAEFEAAEAAFAEEAERNPQLVAQLRASHDPGEFVFAEGLRIKEMADVNGNFLQYREKLTAGHAAALAEKDTRISALQAELDALKKTNADLQSLPRSLNKSPSGAPKAGEEDDEDIGSIVRFNNRKSG
jgi:cell division protein FtsB